MHGKPWSPIIDENGREFHICPKCSGDPQPIENFAKNSSKLNGRAYECNSCAAKRKSAHYQKHRERYANNVAEWKRAHPDSVKTWNQVYRAAHLEEVREKDRLWRAAHRDRDRERKREHERKKPWQDKAAANCNRRGRKKGVPYGIQGRDLLDPKTGALPEFCPIFPHIRLDYTHGPDRRYWASVDRKVPSIGYVSDNVWVVSMAANTWKSNGSNADERAKIVALMSPKQTNSNLNKINQLSLFNMEQ